MTLLLEQSPVTLVDRDFHRRGLLLNLVAVLGQSTCIDVIDFGDGGESNELDDHIDGLVDRAKEENAAQFSCEAAQNLHESNGEGAAWV